MKKIILVGIAVLAVSTSAVSAKKHAPKPKAAAAAMTTTSAGFTAPGSAADRALYKKNRQAAGLK
jgi:hypothetical protein